MRLSMQDKYEFVKAAGRAREANDLTGLIRWVNSIVDAIEQLPDGKNDVPCPPYREHAPVNTFIPYTADQVKFSPIEPVKMDYPPPGRDAR